MNVDPSDIATATNALMAQRLVRKLCQKCKKKVKPKSEDLKEIQESLNSISKAAGVTIPTKIEAIWEPVGCKECKGIGYSGIIPLTEVMTMSEEMEELVSRFSTTAALKKQALTEGMLTMAQDGILRVLAGETSLGEVKRVTEK